MKAFGIVRYSTVGWGITALCVMAAVIVFTLPTAAQDNVVTIVTHDSFSISESVLETFEAQSGVRVQIIRVGDTGTLVNQSILTRGNPLGDVLYGVDNTFLSRALDGDIFIPYQSPLAADLPEGLLLDPQSRVTPIVYGDVCLNADRSYFEDTGLALPETLLDLVDPAYSGLLVVQSPVTSSPGLAFLLTTIAAFGETGDYTYLDYWADLLANDVLIVDNWTNAYYGAFSAASDGSRPLVVSYASSPPAEVLFADPPVDIAPTIAITTPGTCFRQIEFAGVLEGARNPTAAAQLIDFMLDRPFQEDVPLQMFVFPVNPAAELPEVFAEYAVIPDEPVLVDTAMIEAGREGWLEAWTALIRR